MNSVYGFYFAASFARKGEMNDCSDILTEAGYRVTARWFRTGVQHEADVTSLDDLSPGGNARIYANQDLEDIDRAHAVIMFSSRNHDSKGRGGRHAELGYALAHKKLIYLIGEREHCFHALVPDYRCFVNFGSFMHDIAWVALDIESNIERTTDEELAAHNLQRKAVP